MNIHAVAPELVLAGLVLALVPVAGFARGRWRALPLVAAAIGLLASLGVTATLTHLPPTAAFCGTWAVDPFATYYKMLLQIGALITICGLAPYFRGTPQSTHAPLFVLFVTIGGMGLVSSLDLGLIILFLQMISLPAYLIAGLVRSDRRAQEASLKYFLYAAAALAVMAYGLTFLFGLTGSLELRDIGQRLHGADPVWIAVAFGLIWVGYAFEVTLVPFHFWAPDVYDGVTAPVAGFVSVVPKVAAFGGLLRMLLEAFPDGATQWPQVTAAIAVLTMTLGNLAALRQRHLKRLLAYSSIAQAGYILVAIAVAQRASGAVSAVGFYLLAYLLMNLGAFLVVAQFERSFGTDSVAALRGFGRRSPWAGATLMLSLLSLAGIPPLAGFAGKVFLLAAAIDGGMTWLAIIAAINMVVGLFYYVRVVGEMYFEAPAQTAAATPAAGYALGFALTVAGTVAFGIAPGAALTFSQVSGLLR